MWIFFHDSRCYLEEKQRPLTNLFSLKRRKLISSILLQVTDVKRNKKHVISCNELSSRRFHDE